jgi:hypothetical protein
MDKKSTHKERLMALKINDTTLQAAKELNGSGDIAGAYRVLAEAGDKYAANALVVIEQIKDPDSIYARIVQAHWDRVAPGKLEALFMIVGKRHQEQYLELVEGEPSGTDENGEQLYLLANSIQLENSYREALVFYDLPPITTVDSMFSLIDWKLERSEEGWYAKVRAAGGGIEDISWA